MLRDQALAASGLINHAIGGPSVNGYQPEGIWEEATFGKKKYVPDTGDALYRRSLYIFWRRIVGPTTMSSIMLRDKSVPLNQFVQTLPYTHFICSTM